MKIATIFYGYARTFGQLKETYKTAIPKSDVFIYIYDTFYARTHEEEKSIAPKTDNVTFTFKEYFSDVFDIKKFETRKYDIEAYRNIVKINNLPDISFGNLKTHRTFAMIDSIKLAINLKKDYESEYKFEYDCVILTRLDLKFTTPIIIPNNLNKLTHPIGEGWHTNGERKIGLASICGNRHRFNDQVMIGSSKIIDTFLNIDILKMYNKGIEINPETIIGWHCIFNDIDFSAEDICTYGILR